MRTDWTLIAAIALGTSLATCGHADPEDEGDWSPLIDWDDSSYGGVAGWSPIHAVHMPNGKVLMWNLYREDRGSGEVVNTRSYVMDPSDPWEAGPCGSPSCEGQLEGPYFTADVQGHSQAWVATVADPVSWTPV